MDGAVDAAAAHERRVRGVDDGGHVLTRQVATRDLQPPGADHPRHAAIVAHLRARRKGKGREERAGLPAPGVSTSGAERGVLGRLGHHELQPPAGGNLHFLAGLGIPPHPRLVVAHHELPDSGNREAVLGLLVREVGQRLEIRGRRLLRDVDLFGQRGHDLRLGHRLCHRLNPPVGAPGRRGGEAMKKRSAILHAESNAVSTVFAPRARNRPQLARAKRISGRGGFGVADEENGLVGARPCRAPRAPGARWRGGRSAGRRSPSPGARSRPGAPRPRRPGPPRDGAGP